ncbi:MAG TPA: ankyrin repeat domain-containing protein [Candidatus Binataceae bacterium]|nr:ankyrin repeat domain-containing protein [Candidatus Binataceae bacterium]
MASKTRLLELVRSLKWKEAAAALEESPELLAYRDERGRNLLHLACGVSMRDGKRNARDAVDMAKVLLKRGLDINQPAFTEGSWHATPLWYAIARGENLVLAKYLLENGSDPNHCLWAAAWLNDLAAIRLLIAHGAGVNAVTEDESPFLAAIKWSHFETAEELLKHGADPNFRDSKGMTALHYMLKKSSDPEHFRMLLRYGVRGDIGDKAGVTVVDLMRRKKDRELRAMAEELASR